MRRRFSDFLDDGPPPSADGISALSPRALGPHAHLFARPAPGIAAADDVTGSYQANAAFEPVAETDDEPDRDLAEMPDFDDLSDMDTASLARLRRLIAKRHHPDLVPAEARADANRHMAEYNELIDRELEKRRLAG